MKTHQNNMMKKIKNNPMTSLVILSAIGMAYLIYFYNIDGIYVNRPLTFNNNILALETEKSVYHLGETIRIKVNFCKNREAFSQTRWAIIDGKMTYLPIAEPRELPIGCYPKDGKEYILNDVVVIPHDDSLAGHDVHLEGVGTVYLSGGREIKYTYKTKTFRIIY